MKQKRHAAEQIVMKLREAEAGLAAGVSMRQVCQKLGVSEQTFYRRKKKFGGMQLAPDSAEHLPMLVDQHGECPECYSIVASRWGVARGGLLRT